MFHAVRYALIVLVAWVGLRWLAPHGLAWVVLVVGVAWSAGYYLWMKKKHDRGHKP
jgi:hypothetical protein